uniref:Uncharacterized protein n=1 Tax=Daphnia galeata TaxID=27404 RepID=A0A8J2WCV9_9CRUS|nr:unnamed protein product [Daphnia galeata]
MCNETYVIDQKLFREDADTCLLEGLEDTDIHARVEGAALHSSAAAARNVFETDQCARVMQRINKQQPDANNNKRFFKPSSIWQSYKVE